VLGRGESEPADDAAADDEHSSQLIFPGAFHPLHGGHRGMAQVAARRANKKVEYEISIENVDKLPLDYTEMAQRLGQFRDDETVWLTRAPTFVEKGRIFPGATFVVGADTVTRIGDPAYYGSVAARDEALAQLRVLGCRFLVFGRRFRGQYQGLESLELDNDLRVLCDAVAEEEFREDISSTQLRAREREEEREERADGGAGHDDGDA
jgi:hypothetical protein